MGVGLGQRSSRMVWGNWAERGKGAFRSEV